MPFSRLPNQKAAAAADDATAAAGDSSSSMVDAVPAAPLPATVGRGNGDVAVDGNGNGGDSNATSGNHTAISGGRKPTADSTAYTLYKPNK